MENNDADLFFEAWTWSPPSVMESTESRFAHLLQPIRELTKNWDIDVAAELNDYLEEVRELQRFSDCRNVTEGSS